MDLPEFEAFAKQEAAKAVFALRTMFDQHSDIASPAIDAAKAATNDLATLAATEIEHVAPDWTALIEQVKAKVMAEANVKITALEGLKTAVAS